VRTEPENERSKRGGIRADGVFRQRAERAVSDGVRR
jgi:hypothetical protein